LLLGHLAACTFHIEVEAEQVAIPEPLTEPLPIVVGVHYPPDLHTAERTVEDTAQGDSYVVAMGPASVAMFDRILPAMFARVVSVEGMPPAAAGDPAMAGVIVPQLGSVSISGAEVSLDYKIGLYAPAGDGEITWYVRGAHRVEQLGPGAIWERRGGAQAGLAVAMRDAAAQIVTGFCADEKVQRWLATIGIGAGGCTL
jgi:hypothetical protein